MAPLSTGNPTTPNPTPRPTIEERLQAVVETLELVAAVQLDHEKRMAVRMAEYEKRMAQSEERWNQRTAQWDARFDKLLTIVESHERRLDNLERGQR